MDRRRAPRRVSNSQRRDAPVGREQINREQWRCQTKSRLKEVKEDEPRPLETAPKGSCLTMCSVGELRERERQKRLHRFEMMPGTERDRLPRGDPLRAVKEYTRPAAGKDSTNPAELRPAEVLLKTVCYLIDDIAASSRPHPWTEVYSFVFDRLRGVKQDMIIQRISGLNCVAILERMVRFLIYSSYRLCGEPPHLYNPCINDTHLQENLTWLLDSYAREKGPYPNQEEFYALGLLYNLGLVRPAQHILELPKGLRSSPTITLALSINKAFLERNPVCVLRLAQRLDFLQSCALHRHLVACRRDLLLIYSHGYNSRNCRFPLDRLAQLLSLDASHAAQLCRAYGLEVTQDSQVVFCKTAFAEPEKGNLLCKQYHSIVADKQKDLAIENIIHGCT
ncbi:SAC3 domain-containing protein 1 isoform X1 [Takifugu rubripes]|uniref:SAC3 domain-containing protein 1 isoform X1 n=1 Tax=Takifugu rubripes TaxID=31033 RepID=UPI0011459431|nr:SAC3 domain-containing protein 1 isoform X1 [Takifugu rubripes]